MVGLLIFLVHTEYRQVRYWYSSRSRWPIKQWYSFLFYWDHKYLWAPSAAGSIWSERRSLGPYIYFANTSTDKSFLFSYIVGSYLFRHTKGTSLVHIHQLFCNSLPVDSDRAHSPVFIHQLIQINWHIHQCLNPPIFTHAQYIIEQHLV